MIVSGCVAGGSLQRVTISQLCCRWQFAAGAYQPLRCSPLLSSHRPEAGGDDGRSPGYVTHPVSKADVESEAGNVFRNVTGPCEE